MVTNLNRPTSKPKERGSRSPFSLPLPPEEVSNLGRRVELQRS
ncbi:MAG: hypothetical protein ACTS80_01870 [Candidatus Hodgkinia cicadicola]